MNFRDCLIAQFATHPSTAPQDAVKQCYQAAFGAEHLLTDTSLAAAYLEREFNDTPAADVPLCEKIAPDVGRINLASWKAHGLPLEWLTRMFIMSARPDEAARLSSSIVFPSWTSWFRRATHPSPPPSGRSTCSHTA